MRGERIGPSVLQRIRTDLTDTQRAVLETVAEHRFVTGGQIEALHFASDDETGAAKRRAQRTLQRMTDQRLLERLDRRIGGVRAGSASYVYRLGPAGTRLLDLPSRFRQYEPSVQFLDHTLAISQLVVDLTAAGRRGGPSPVALQTEPRCWRRIPGRLGPAGWLRPDLYAEIAAGDDDLCWFIEVDLGTKAMRRLLATCKAYETYYRSGREQEEHGVTPRVLWLMDHGGRAQRLRQEIERDRSLTSELFVVTTLPRAVEVAAGGEP